MGDSRDKTIKVSEKEKKLLDKLRKRLYRSDSVPYGEVITNLVEKALKELDELEAEKAEGDTIADHFGL